MTVRGLYNKQITNPFRYCGYKKVFLTFDDFVKKQCTYKKCHYCITLGNQDLEQYETREFDVDEYWGYRYTNRKFIKMSEAAERRFRRKNLSAVPELKKQLSERKQYSWSKDLDSYYNQKYGA